MGTVYYFAAQRTPRLDVDWKAVAPQGVSHGRIGTLPAR